MQVRYAAIFNDLKFYYVVYFLNNQLVISLEHLLE